MRVELMILSDLKRDPWVAVIMPLPKTANLRLLAAARRAARLCQREARTMLEFSHRYPQDQIDEMRYLVGECSARIGEINERAALVFGCAPAYSRLDLR